MTIDHFKVKQVAEAYTAAWNSGSAEAVVRCRPVAPVFAQTGVLVWLVFFRLQCEHLIGAIQDLFEKVGA